MSRRTDFVKDKSHGVLFLKYCFFFLRDAAMLLVQLASTVEVDIMPGKGDPAGCALPQQPMNRWMTFWNLCSTVIV